MLKGHTFNLQTFTSEAFALFIDKFLDGRSGVAKGCSLSNTNNSVTIGEGYFVIRGRLLQVISGVTISNITNNGYYSLVCEIDLSKTNTTDTLNQAEIKTLYNASAYPTLTQQDITGSGTVYQYEFARFKVESGNITNFTDRRTFVNYETILDLIQNALDDVLDESIYKLKGDFAVVSGVINVIPSRVEYIVEYPDGFNSTNSVALSFETHGNINETGYTLTYSNRGLVIFPEGTIIQGPVPYKIVLMKIS